MLPLRDKVLVEPWSAFACAFPWQSRFLVLSLRERPACFRLTSSTSGIGNADASARSQLVVPCYLRQHQTRLVRVMPKGTRCRRARWKSAGSSACLQEVRPGNRRDKGQTRMRLPRELICQIRKPLRTPLPHPPSAAPIPTARQWHRAKPAWTRDFNLFLCLVLKFWRRVVMQKYNG